MVDTQVREEIPSSNMCPLSDLSRSYVVQLVACVEIHHLLPFNSRLPLDRVMMTLVMGSAPTNTSHNGLTTK